LREEIELGASEVVVHNGEVAWEKDAELLAMFGGESAEAIDFARSVGGYPDYPYKHDPVSGARLPLVVRRHTPAALRIHGARSVLGGAGWNPSERREVDQRVNGKVLITGASRQGAAARPAYAKPELSPLQRDLLQRVAALDAPGRVTKATRPVDFGASRGDGNDPPEKIGA
jgi:hypothetical protein